jgi:hypothetical protein
VIGMDFATCDTDTAFAELIYADAQWLREEFDALIAASFGQPPAAPPPAPPRVPSHRRPPGTPGWRQPQPHPTATSGRVTAPGQRRQRSPPA